MQVISRSHKQSTLPLSTGPRTEAPQVHGNTIQVRRHRTCNLRSQGRCQSLDQLSLKTLGVEAAALKLGLELCHLRTTAGLPGPVSPPDTNSIAAESVAFLPLQVTMRWRKCAGNFCALER